MVAREGSERAVGCRVLEGIERWADRRAFQVILGDLIRGMCDEVWRAEF